MNGKISKTHFVHISQERFKISKTLDEHIMTLFTTTWYLKEVHQIRDPNGSNVLHEGRSICNVYCSRFRKHYTQIVNLTLRLFKVIFLTMKYIISISASLHQLNEISHGKLNWADLYGIDCRLSQGLVETHLFKRARWS